MTATSVFVTGGTGFAGAAVVAELVRSGWAVTALVRGKEQIAGCRTVRGDLATSDRLAGEVGKAGAVVHLASPRSLSRQLTVSEDILGTAGLVDAWRAGPFVYASSTTIHGIPTARLRADTPIDLLEWYDVGKAVNEYQVRAASGTGGRGPGVSLRPTMYLGGGSRSRDRQMLAMIVDVCRAGGTFIFKTDEALETSGAAYIGLGDFARAVTAALGLSTGGAFPIAGGFARWRDLIDLVNRRAGSAGRYVVRADGAHDDEDRLAHSRTEVDSSAFEAATGWHAQESLDDLVGAFLGSDKTAVA
jgi:nucleoside-diphosphate-sugar epimerase